MKLTGFSRFAWGSLAYSLLVGLWGIYGRASGSGAGCGTDWPLCNGVLIPLAGQAELLAAWIHRLSSGLGVLLGLAGFAWAWRVFPKGHAARLGAGLALLFWISGALAGAGLSWTGWIVQDAAGGRGLADMLKLASTFWLAGALALTAWWGMGGERVNLRGYGPSLWIFGVGLAAMLLFLASGGLAELAGLQFSSRLLSALAGLYLLAQMAVTAMFRAGTLIRRLALATSILVGVQWLAGWTNQLLQAPVWMQIINGLLAMTLWVVYLLLLAATFGENEVYQHV